MLSTSIARSRLPSFLKLDTRAKRVLRGAVWTLGSKVAATSTGFLLNVLLARHMGVEGYGIFSYVLSLVLFLTALSCFGLNQAGIRFVAGYVIEQKYSLLRGFARWAQWFALFLGIAVAVALGLYAVYLDSGPSDERQALLIGSVVVVVGGLIAVQAGILRGLKRVWFGDLAESGGLRSLLAFLCLAGLLLMGSQLDSPSQGMALLAMSTLVTLAATTVVVGRALPGQVRSCSSAYDMREWLVTATPVFLMAAAVLAQNQVNILMLRHLASVEAVGVFAAAARIAILVSFALGAINAALAPEIAEMYTAGRLKDLQRLLYYTATLTSVAALGVCLAGVIGGRYALSLFGPDFERGYLPLVILLAAEGFSTLAGSTGYLMTMTGLHHAAAAIALVTAVINIALNAVLIPLYGTSGAATSTMISTIFWNTYVMLYLYSKANIRSTPVLLLIDYTHTQRRPK
jgi:O-antigen/teichoic acid export membrane protein